MMRHLLTCRVLTIITRIGSYFGKLLSLVLVRFGASIYSEV